MVQQPKIIRFVYKAPVVLIGFVGYCYAMILIVNYEKDTTNITNVAFVIMATLSALAFTFAQAMDQADIKDRLVFSGERLLHGALLVLIGSILKYFIVAFVNYQLISKYEYLVIVTKFTIGMLVGIIFTNGVLFAHTGLRILNDLLLLRFTRHKYWDDIW